MTQTRDARTYEMQKIRLRLLGTAMMFVAMGLLTWLSPTLAEWMSTHIGSRWLALFGFGAAVYFGYEILTLPLSYYAEFSIEHGYNLSNQTVRGWIVHTLKEWLVSVIMMGILIGGLYTALWYGGRFWWLWVWCGWLILTVGLVRLFPVVILPLFYKSTPIDNPGLAERFARLSERTNLVITGVYKLDLSKDTKKANAMLAGLGASRRVYLSDTLLEAFDEEEIGVVFAHELGHHVHGHITKGLTLSAVLSTITIAIVAAILSPYAGSDPSLCHAAISRLPAVSLAVSLLSLCLMPLGNAITRHFERQSDTEALNRTRNPAAYRSAMTKLGEMNLADYYPPRWVEIMFHDHPALGSRIALADRWVGTKDLSSPQGPVG